MRHHLLAAAALSALSLTACSEGHAESAGPAVSRTYQVANFSGIEVSGPFDVKVATGKAISVAARGPQKLLDETEVTVEGGKLVIRPKRKGWFGGMNWGSNDPAVFNVTVPSLESVAVAGSGDVDVDRIAGERFRGNVAGSGDLRLPQVAVTDLGLSIAGSGGIKAAGQAQQARYEIAGSGDVDASGLRSTDASADIAGSGSIRAQVTGTAKASIAGSGDIDIRGGARCQSSKHGSGDIRCS
ncbi:head GIN domain-containing protein [Sphingomonas humi]|uniref:Head GIN domain-containing protein n=1 Tax=Sphingomonas humi TaxID=335630 RepID=A0ABP7RIR8_9SPHN